MAGKPGELYMYDRRKLNGSHEQLKKIPVTSLMRTWVLGSTQAKIGAQYLGYFVRKGLLDEDGRQLAQDRMKLKAALQLLGTMGYLRGAVMKMGQLIANLPQVVGPEMVDIFQSLHFEAPPMHYSLIREVFLDEFGKDPREVFASFEKKAFAAASLGQVHRARLHDGTDVAVKIQYPNIGQTIQSDFKTMATLLRAIRFRDDWKYLCAHVEDAREVFYREIDYRREAAFMEQNRRLFEGTEVAVPRSYPAFSSEKVLTMDFLHGEHLPAFLASNPTQEARNHFGALISFSLIRCFFAFQTIYADLHPGNYIFMEDGRLGFIDFGCYRRFGQERWRFEMECEAAMFNNDIEGILRFLAGVIGCTSKDELDPAWKDLLLRQVDWVVRPITTKGIFDFAEPAFVDEGVQLFRDIFREMSIQRGYSRMDSFYNWTNRAIIGHRALMFRLQAKFDYSSLYLEEMQRAK